MRMSRGGGQRERKGMRSNEGRGEEIKHELQSTHTLHSGTQYTVVHIPATRSSLSLALSSENRPNSMESNVDILEVRTGMED